MWIPQWYTVCMGVMQVNALNVLNIMLVNMPRQDQLAASFLSDHHMLLRAVSLLSEDRACARVQPKALLTCALLTRLGPEWLCVAIEAGLLGRIERAVGGAGTATSPNASENSDRELSAYTTECRDGLLNAVGEVVSQLLEEVSTDYSWQGSCLACVPTCWKWLPCPSCTNALHSGSSAEVVPHAVRRGTIISCVPVSSVSLRKYSKMCMES